MYHRSSTAVLIYIVCSVYHQLLVVIMYIELHMSHQLHTVLFYTFHHTGYSSTETVFVFNKSNTLNQRKRRTDKFHLVPLSAMGLADIKLGRGFSSCCWRCRDRECYLCFFRRSCICARRHCSMHQRMNANGFLLPYDLFS
jgi:hypothetical protein